MKDNIKNNCYIEFVDKIFERAANPIEQLQRIFENHPIIFFIREVCDHINEKLRKLGYKLNMDYIKEINNIYYSCSTSRPSCSGTRRGCGSSRPSCSGRKYHHRNRRKEDEFDRILDDNPVKGYRLVTALESVQ